MTRSGSFVAPLAARSEHGRLRGIDLAFEHRDLRANFCHLALQSDQASRALVVEANQGLQASLL